MATPSFFSDDQLLCKTLQGYVNSASQTFILTDSNVAEAVVPRILANLKNPESIEIIELEPGEDSKSIDVATQIWGRLLECNADRNTLILAIGGGVVTDLAGFVASNYKRGIAFIHIPTSLMAMTDAAIGGKTGIDLDHFKNAIGTFALPKAILIQPDFIFTLPQEEILSGFAEMIKHGIIADASLFEALSTIEDANPHHIALFIQRSASVKNTIVEQDFTEQNIRKTLNFGHTIGHAIESACLSFSPISHGHAVAIGMIIEAKLAFTKHLITEREHTLIDTFLRSQYSLKHKLDWENVVVFLRNDKKNEKDSIRFALPTAIGKAQWNIEIEENEIKAAMCEYLSA